MSTPHHELEQLLSALCDGSIDEAQLERLEAMLEQSAENRRVYLQYMDMHARMTMHPHLATGIPLDVLGSEKDDEVVLSLAKTSLDQLAGKPTRPVLRRRMTSWGRHLGLLLLVGVAVAAWYYYNASGQSQPSGPILREVAGEVLVSGAAGTYIAEVGEALRIGQQLEVGSDDARAVLEYADGTRVVVHFSSRVEVPEVESGTTLRLLGGAMEVDAAPQPTERPLVFATDHARYVVLGTRFRLYRKTTASRLELHEGKVQLQRQVDGTTIDVSAGHVAVATAEATPIVVQPLATGSGTLAAEFPKAGQTVAISGDGSLVATGDWERGLRIWRPGDPDPTHYYKARIGNRGQLGFDNQRIVHVSSETKHRVVMSWIPGQKDAASMKLPGTHVRRRSLSPDAEYVAESGEEGTRIFATRPHGRAKLKPLAEIPAKRKAKAWCLAMSVDADTIAGGFWDGTLQVYRMMSPELPGAERSYELFFEKKLTHTPTEIALSIDGQHMAVYSQKDGLVYFDLAESQQRVLWAPGASGVRCLEFTPDGEKLIAGMTDGTARMWSVLDGRALLVIDTGHGIRDIAWSQETSTLATAGGSVKLWKCELP